MVHNVLGKRRELRLVMLWTISKKNFVNVILALSRSG